MPESTQADNASLFSVQRQRQDKLAAARQQACTAHVIIRTIDIICDAHRCENDERTGINNCGCILTAIPRYCSHGLLYAVLVDCDLL